MPTWFQTTQIARPQFYDRNAQMAITAYNIINIAPHGLTNRTSFTVAPNKKAWLDSIWMHMVRSAVAAPQGLMTNLVQYTPSGGGSQALGFIYFNSNTAFDPRALVLPNEGYIAQGDLVQFQTSDASTGGFAEYAAAMKVTSYDV